MALPEEIVAGAGAGAERAHARASPPVEIDVAALGSNGAAAHDSGNASAAVVPEDAARGTFTRGAVRLEAGRAERFLLLRALERPGGRGPSGATPALVVPVLVGVAPLIAALAAMIRCCRGTGGLPVSVEALASHECFQVGDVLVDAVMAEFSALAEAQQQLRHEAPPGASADGVIDRMIDRAGVHIHRAMRQRRKKRRKERKRRWNGSFNERKSASESAMCCVDCGS